MEYLKILFYVKSLYIRLYKEKNSTQPYWVFCVVPKTAIEPL